MPTCIPTNILEERFADKSSSEATFGVNRRVRKSDGNYDFGANPAGVTDPDVPVLLVQTPEGAPRAVVFTYACHCTSIRNGHEGFYQYHPDYAGVAADEIERQLPRSTALYVTGCAGEIDPQPQGGVKVAELHGRSLATVVLALVNRTGLRAVRGAVANHVPGDSASPGSGAFAAEVR